LTSVLALSGALHLVVAQDNFIPVGQLRGSPAGSSDVPIDSMARSASLQNESSSLSSEVATALQDCCSLCPNHMFCSPESQACYVTKRKSYYTECGSAAQSCCSRCPQHSYCSPVSNSCYDSRLKSYYTECSHDDEDEDDEGEDVNDQLSRPESGCRPDSGLVCKAGLNCFHEGGRQKIGVFSTQWSCAESCRARGGRVSVFHPGHGRRRRRSGEFRYCWCDSSSRCDDDQRHPEAADYVSCFS